MQKFSEAVYALAITLWVGGLFAIGYMAVPVLFAQIADRTFAGSIAAAMFSTGAWVSDACAVLLATLMLAWHGKRVVQNPVWWIVVAMLLLGLLGQFYIQPVIAAIKQHALPLAVSDSPLKAEFGRWHGISSMVYLVQAVLGVALVVLQGKGKPAGKQGKA